MNDDGGDGLCYVALHDCGGWRMVSVIVDDPQWRNDQARKVADCIRAGLQIETWTVAKFSTESKMCQCLKKGRQKQKSLLK